MSDKYLCSAIGDIVYAGAYRRTLVTGADTEEVNCPDKNWVLTIERPILTLSAAAGVVLAIGTRAAAPCPKSIEETITGFVPPPPRIIGVEVRAIHPVWDCAKEAPAAAATTETEPEITGAAAAIVK